MEIQALTHSVEQVGAYSVAVQIADDQELENATQILLSVKTLQKNIKTEKDKFILPAKKIINETKERFKFIEDRCAEVETALKLKINAYLTEKTAAKQKQEEELLEKLNTNQISLDEAASQITLDVKPVGLSTRAVKKLVIEDESLIPEKYWQLDKVAIRKDLMAGIFIPGAILQEENIITTKS